MLVPENIFEIAAPVDNIIDYEALGAKFKAFQDKTQFSISITFEIANLAYYDDEPLLINTKQLDLNNIGELYINSDLGQIQNFALLNPIQTSISQETLDSTGAEIKDALNTFTNIPDDADDLPTCPEPTQEDLDKINEENTTTIDIKNQDDEIIEQVTVNYADNEYVCNNSDTMQQQLKSSFLNALPKINPGNNIAPATTSPLCKLPDDSEIKGIVETELKKLDITETSTQDYAKKLLDDGITKAVQDQLTIMGDSAGVDTNDVSSEVINNQVNDILKSELPSYGIPLLQINLDLNILIQVIDGKLEVLNFDKYIDGQSILNEEILYSQQLPELNVGVTSIPDTAKKKLEIEIDDPDAKIIPETIYTLVYTRKFNYHSIKLKKFYGTKVFTDSETSTINTGLYYLGMDKSGLKQFCGKFYDVHLQQDEIDINDITFGRMYFPDIYGALAYYDFWNKSDTDTRINYNRVYAYKSLGKPLSLRGNYWYLESRKDGNYTFPNHCYIDDLFCKNKFTNKSFSICLFFKRNSFQNPSARNEIYQIQHQTILSDPLNDNEIYYNERNMLLCINFHGKYEEIFINFVPDYWYMLNIRYDFINQKFITDVKYKVFTGDTQTESFEFLLPSSTRSVKSIMSLDEDLEEAELKRFELNSIYAKYSFSEKGYITPFDTLCGPIILYDKFLEDLLIDGIFESFYPVLDYYKDVGGIYSADGILPNY